MLTTSRRIGRLREELRRRRLDGLLVTHLPHVRYLTNFSGSNGLCLVRPREVFFFTDSRYSQQASREVKDAVCEITASDLVIAAAKALPSGKPLRLGFESDYLSVHQHGLLKKVVRNGVAVPARGILESLVGVKERGEISALRKAVSISSRVFETILDSVRPGVRECEIAAEISFQHKRLGAGGDAFEPIVAAGKRSAIPHARPSQNRLRRGDMVILDFGCTVNGYHSDMTRTVVIGKPTPRFRKLYDAVLEARDRAVDHVRPGVRTSVLDGIARRSLAGQKLEKYFIHSLGHGVGLSIHERPRISSLSTEQLQEGNTVTIEPGVYVPGFGGIRIEDIVLVTKRGCSVLCDVPRNLTIV